MSKMIAYSTDEETFPYDTLEEAVDASLNDGGCEDGDVVTFWEGEVVERVASDYLHCSSCFGYLEAKAWDELGEIPLDWLRDVTKEQEKELEVMFKQTLDKWADLHDKQPQFSGVINLKKVVVRIDSVEDCLFAVLPDGEHL